MSTLYSDSHRKLQGRHDTVKLAALLDQTIVHNTLTPEDSAFIDAQDMFFLATVDDARRPTVSYKGGAKGFVRVQNGEIAFPCYDGNGMFLSMGISRSSQRWDCCLSISRRQTAYGCRAPQDWMSRMHVWLGPAPLPSSG
jgi:hypothetical protein